MKVRPKRNPEFDEYIAGAAPFARPILKRLRRLFHEACPQIEERLKWGHPSFEYRGIVGGFAAFKNHATFGFWRQDLLPDPHGLFQGSGPLGSERLTNESQLPSDEVLLDYIREAVRLNESGPPPRKRSKEARPEIAPPDDFVAALRRNRKALATFESFPPSRRSEYVEWVEEAKKEETRRSRIDTAVEWMAEGKPRNWKYMKKK